MASQKVIDNSNRLRYIRALERFYKSMVSYLLNTSELTLQGYEKKIDNSLKLLNRVEEVNLYKGELKDLQNLVKTMIEYKGSQKDIQDIKSDILYRSNQLDKSKNARRYKKDKHSKHKFSEWD